MIQLSHPYTTTGKTITLTVWTFVNKVMSLFNNMLSRSVIGEGDGTPLQYSCLANPMDRGAWKAAVHGVAEGWTWLSDFTFTFHFHALEKEMATHSSVLPWRSPGTGEPGGLLSMGSHRVGHDWSDLVVVSWSCFLPSNKCFNFVTTVTVHSGNLEPKKIKSVTVSIISPSICHKVMGPDSMILVFWMLTFKPEVNIFLEFTCFFYDPTYVDSLIFRSSAFSKSNSYIWKFLVQVLLKRGLKDFEHYFARMWNEHNCAVVWTFFVGIATYNFGFFVLCVFFYMVFNTSSQKMKNYQKGLFTGKT